MRRRSPFEERRQNIGKARDWFLRAATMLLDDGFAEDAAPLAAVYAGIGLVHLGKADEKGEDGARAMELTRLLAKMVKDKQES